MRLTQRLQALKTPQDRYDLNKSERKHLLVKAPTSKEVDIYQSRIEKLADLMKDAPFRWDVEGGYVLPLRTGQFNRQHGDIDIGFYECDLPRAIPFFSQKGYGFFYRNYHFPQLENTSWDLFERANEIQIMKREPKRLYLMKTNIDGTIDESETTLREIDLHIHEKVGETVYTSKQRFALPASWFNEVFTSKERYAQSVEVGSLKVFYFFKLGGNRPRHIFDRKIIEEKGLLTPEEIVEVKKIREKISFR